MNRKKKERIIVFSAHSDDFVFGVGGTIAKYAQQGKKVTVIVFSYGEKSHPWLKEKEVQKMRAQEAFAAGRLLKCKVIFFGLREGNFIEDYNAHNLEKEILTIMEREHPAKVFTHSSEDPHPDHKTSHNITMDIYYKLKYHPEIYIYSVWNPVEFRTNFPALLVDVSKTFFLKIKALRTFPSQKFHAIYPLMFIVFFRALINGFRVRKRFAEKFFRIK